MNLFKDFADLIILFQKYKVEYIIVGGYAVGVHSQARMTQDINFWIKPTVENAKKLISALDEFGTPDLKLSTADIINPETVIHFGKSPLRIDILSSIDGVKFDEAYKNRFIHDLGNVRGVNFISLNDLIENKKASNRQKDNFDLQWLKEYGKSN